VRSVPAEEGEVILLYLQLAQQLLQDVEGEGALGLIDGHLHCGLQLPQVYVLREGGLANKSARHQQTVEVGQCEELLLADKL
jgi:hypothetical protein